MEYSKKEINKTVWINKEYLQNFYTDKKPNWVRFCEKLLNNNYTVFLDCLARTGSIYLTVLKNNKMVKIRYSNHWPRLKTWLVGKVDYFVGPEYLGMISENEILNILKIRFRK